MFLESKAKKKEKLAHASQNSRTRTPCVRSFQASFPSFIFCHAGGEIQKFCIYKTERKQKDEWKERRIHETRVPRIGANREMQFSSSFTRTRTRASKREENARKKHLSIFSLVVDTKSTNLVRFSSSFLRTISSSSTVPYFRRRERWLRDEWLFARACTERWWFLFMRARFALKKWRI